MKIAPRICLLLLGGWLSMMPMWASADPLADTRLTQAWENFGRSHWSEAKEAFGLASASAEEDLRAQAFYGLGMTALRQVPSADVAAAQTAFGKIVETMPTSPIAPWALIELGNIEYDAASLRIEKARQFYERVLADYPESEAIHEATLRLAGTWFIVAEGGSTQKGLSLLETHLERYPDNPLAAMMHLRLDYTYCVQSQDYPAALRHAIAVAQLGINDPKRSSSHLWHIGQLAEIVGDTPVAVHWYEALLIASPDSAQGLAASQRLVVLREEAGDE